MRTNKGGEEAVAFLDRLKHRYEKRNSVDETEIFPAEQNIIEEEIAVFKAGNTEDLEGFDKIEEMLKKDYSEYVKRKEEAGEPFDYSLNLYISQDKMTAYGCVFPPVLGGQDMNGEGLEEDANLEGIIHGLCSEAMEQIAARRLYYRIFVAARGTCPVEGMDGRIIDYIERRDKISVEADENNIVDFDRPEIFYHIKKGEVICRIEPATKGTDGCNVVGGALPASVGKPAKIPKGKNTVISKDGSVLLAERGGHIFYKEEAFSIENTLIIEEDLEGSSGPLEFMENITIIGNVGDGVSISTKGNVMIGGKVGAAEIKAGGNIYIHRGMDGKQQGRLIAEGTVKCRSLANTKVSAQGNIYANAIVQCDITTSSSVFVKGAKGILAGGVVRVKNCLEARRIGNISGRINLVFIGDTRFLKEIERIEKRITEIDQNLDKIARILFQIKNDLSKEKMETSYRLRQQRELYLKEKKGLVNQLSGIYADHGDKKVCYVKAENILPHTIVDYLGKKLAIKEPRDNCRIYFDGDLRFE